MEHGEGRHEAALRAVQRAPAKPWRGAGAGAPPPPRVYRVEPRDFRELVQRLTGAGTASASATTAQAPAHAAAAHGRRREAAPAEQFDYSSWFSAPLLSPASMPAGMDAHHGALL
ncbi:hypothetical protein D1007_50945 [Hordeum vulgare]|uniref:Predicted protein n=1 Tax=Hordeum vulgare subsp. vulgare TaxID=112509 RepID=F2DAU8_HORVV|nr:VQ motif-containing protein 29-like [Hordeum vulgare subsp. vulgare]KAE8776417.1 hypothetical protein D1007_50945 [Hordeum vulgare]BAJ92219.1 predicted protein [Hordeum vulgare subsp. vulgare]